MPISANVTTTSGVVATFPAGASHIIVQNESDTAIRIQLGTKQISTTATVGAIDTGILVPPLASGIPGEFRHTFSKPLKQPMALVARHAGVGDKLLTYNSITEPTH
jgi:hypothetical protein